MAKDVGVEEQFAMAMHDLLNVLQALQLQYDLAMEAVKKCRGLEEEGVECLGNLDRAWAEARILEELGKRYARILGELKELAHKKYGVTRVDSAG